MELENVAENKEIAELLFPDVENSTEYYESKYPGRTLSKDSRVTRFGPSPTGFVHIGSLFAALVSERVAHQSNGIFYLRIEDTDKKREVNNGIKEITDALSKFSIKIDEGVTGEEKELGNYGPYKQSERKEVYQTFAKKLIVGGLAYPCFCSPEELEEARKAQEVKKIKPGYYGEWAKHRNIGIKEVKTLISSGKSFVVRLRSIGNEANKLEYEDLVKGGVTLTENDQDIVLIKSDGLPTYHFAHVIDDHLMRTTHVIRGDEWLSSLPVHLQLFKLLGWVAPNYAHISPIMKLEGKTKRKLSKRKDPEAAINYYLEGGYPIDSVIEYLLNIANSDFEDWRKLNPKSLSTEFQIKLDKFGKSGALFDLNKLTDISKQIVASMSAEDVFSSVLGWANVYDQNFAGRLLENKEYFIKIFSIERGGENPRKDLGKWSDVQDNTFYFFNDLYRDRLTKSESLPFPLSLSKDDVKNILSSYSELYKSDSSKDQWFDDLKKFAERLGFAKDAKTHKQNPSSYKGHVGDVAMVLRVALTTKTKTPDLYEILKVMGDKLVRERLAICLEHLG